MDSPFPKSMVADFEEFLKTTHGKLPKEKKCYREIYGINTLFPLQRPAELERMVDLCKTLEPTTIMEIGTDKPGSLYHWCMNFPEAKYVIACEIRGIPFKELFENYFPEKKFLWLECSSLAYNAIKLVEDFLTKNKTTIDILFIDGDKSKFYEDFRTYLECMSRESLVLLHDVNDTIGRQALIKISSLGYSTSAIIDISDYKEFMESKRKPSNAYENWLVHWAGRSCGVGVIKIDRMY